jgi:hypothetical protein
MDDGKVHQDEFAGLQNASRRRAESLAHLGPGDEVTIELDSLTE